MPENNGGRPATAGGLEETTLGRALPSLLNGFGLLPFSDIAFKSLPVNPCLPYGSHCHSGRTTTPGMRPHHVSKKSGAAERPLTPQTGASHQAQPLD